MALQQLCPMPATHPPTHQFLHLPLQPVLAPQLLVSLSPALRSLVTQALQAGRAGRIGAQEAQ